MSNIFKLYPTHFSRGGKKLSRGDSPPWLQALWLAQVVFSYFVLYSSKIPLVPATKVTPLCSLLFGFLLFCTVQQQDTFGACDQSDTFVQPAVQTAGWSKLCS